MGRQIFSFKGMMRDLSVSKSSSNYAYEIRNMRLTAQEDTTLLTLVTEKGNREYTIVDSNNNTVTLYDVIGYCTLGKWLVLFSHDSTEGDFVYKLYEVAGNSMVCYILYNGDLGFGDTGVDIDALGCYENENVQKVYWVDSVHQPRVINIMADDSERQSWNNMETPFDFIPKLSYDESVNINKVDYNGMFSPGTLQYVFTYYKRNGQQTNPFHISPMYYTSHINRGASPEDTVSNSFEIKVYNPDTSFDFIRVYSILRTSQDDTPMCKRVYDIPLANLENDFTERYYTIDFELQQPQYSFEYTAAHPDTKNIKILKINDSVYNQYNVKDFLHSTNGNINRYIIPSEYYVCDFSGIDLTVDNGFQKYLYRSANDADAIEIRHIYGDTDSIRFANVEYINGEYVDYDASEMTRSDVTIAHYALTRQYCSIIDNGIIGEDCSLEEVIYAGGQVISPKTLSQKNNTMFFGNYRNINSPVITDGMKLLLKNSTTVSFGYSETKIDKGMSGSFYAYKSQLDMNSFDITSYKGGEQYVLGIVLQDSSGQWSDVIPLNTVTNPLYPKDYNNYFYPVKAFVKLNTDNSDITAFLNNYHNVKFVLLDSVHSVLCQGVISPTVFNYLRKDNAPYALSSWYFRDVESDSLVNFRPQAKCFHNIRNNYDSFSSVGEIQYASKDDRWFYRTGIQEYSNFDMFVDWNLITIHSPEIDFSNVNLKQNLSLNIVGALKFDGGISSKDISITNPKNIDVYSIERPLFYRNMVSPTGFAIDMCSYCYTDENVNSTDIMRYPVYTWHRNKSIFGQGSADSDWYGILDYKIFSSLRTSLSNRFFNIPSQLPHIDIGSYQSEDEMPVVLRTSQTPYVYYGSVDLELSEYGLKKNYAKQSNGTITELSGQESESPDTNISVRYKSSNHLVALLGNNYSQRTIVPNVFLSNEEKKIFNDVDNYKYAYFYNVDGSYNTGDYITLHVSGQVGDFYVVTGFNDNPGTYRIYAVYSSSYYQIELKPIEEWTPYWQDMNSIWNNDDIVPEDTYRYGDIHWQGDVFPEVYRVYNIYFRVSSTINGVLHYFHFTYRFTRTLSTTWNEGNFVIFNDYQITDTESIGIQFNTSSLDVGSLAGSAYSYIVELKLANHSISEAAVKNSPWITASGVYDKDRFLGRQALECQEGDTYYQRYDCLKTFPFSTKDKNQVVEIFSFMCESHLNIDGRYDNLRGLRDNTIITGDNFNKFNMAYTQKDNVRMYHYLDSELFGVDYFPTQVLWTKTKVYGEEIDSWTQIQATSVLDMDGTLGPVSTLRLWNDNLLCWQSKGFSRIQYNDRNAIATSSGVPVELANSGKVDGKNYISTQAGTDNMHTVQTTQHSVYFTDTSTNDIYRFSEGLVSLSKTKGFNVYMNSIRKEGLRTFYDPKLQDLYFRTSNTPIDVEFGNGDSPECLVFNEQLSEFTSFFDYDMDFMFPLQDSLVSIRGNRLYKQFAGDYLDYFGNIKDYSVEFVANENPLADKIFTNIEFRSDVFTNNGVLAPSSVPYSASGNMLPFGKIRVWNEYQDTGDVDFETMIRRGVNMSQKFRIWRADIPRERGSIINRIRNTWTRIKLWNTGKSVKTALHDMNVIYY